MGAARRISVGRLCDWRIFVRAAPIRYPRDCRFVSGGRCFPAEEPVSERSLVCEEPCVSNPNLFRQRLSVWAQPMDFCSGGELGIVGHRRDCAGCETTLALMYQVEWNARI